MALGFFRFRRARIAARSPDLEIRERAGETNRTRFAQPADKDSGFPVDSALPNTWLCCLGAAGFLSWLFLDNIFAPLYITEVAHQAPTTAGFLMGASGLVAFFWRYSFPHCLTALVASQFVDHGNSMLGRSLALLVPELYSYSWVLASIIAVTNAGQGIGALVLVLVPTESVPPQFAATAIG